MGSREGAGLDETRRHVDRLFPGFCAPSTFLIPGLMRNTLLVFAAATFLAVAPAHAQVQQASAPAPSADAELMARAQLDGKAAAATVGSAGWFGGGFVGGLVAGLIGTGVTYAIAASSNVEVPAERRLLIVSQPATYQQMFEKGYADKVKSKRKSSALTGGLLGTATLVAIVIGSQ